MTLLIYLPNEPLGKQGGMERVTHHLAEMLHDAGYSVLLLCRNKNRLGESYQPPVPLTFIPKNLSSTEEQKWLVRYLEDNRVSTLIDQTEGGIIGKWGIFPNRKNFPVQGIRLIAVQHSSQYTYLKYYRSIQRRHFNSCFLAFFYNECLLRLKQWHAYHLQKSLFKALSENYDYIVTLSQGGIDEFTMLCPTVNRDKLVSIPNAVAPCPPPDLSKKEKRCLYVGRLDNAAKGVDRLLRIWQQVEQQDKEWQLDIVGDGQDGERLRQCATKLYLQRVHFHGFQNPVLFYQRASIFCMTSTFEGFGMVLIEAMQHGCVPIAFDSYPAVRDIVKHETTGILAKPFDEVLYIQFLNEIIKNTQQRLKIQKSAYSSVNRFYSSVVLQKWKNII